MDAHELTKTRLCKTSNCTGEAIDLRGRYALLCEVCKESAVRQSREARVVPIRDPQPVPTATPTSFEKRAKELVEVGKRVDTALAKVKRHRSAGVAYEDQLRAAMADWKAVCERIGSNGRES